MKNEFIGGTLQRNAASWRIDARKYRGTGQTVRMMAKLAKAGQADPKVRRFAVAVVRRVTPKDYVSELAALFYEACRRIRYTRDPANVELVHHPRLTLQNRHGDCDDMAIALAAMAKALPKHRNALASAAMALGNNLQYCLVGFRQFGGPTHVYLRARHPKTGAWMVLDPVAGPNTAAMVRAIKVHRPFWV